MPRENSKSNLLNRRRVIQGLGGAGIAGLAGCSGGGGGEGGGGETQSGGETTGGSGSGEGGKLKLAQEKSPVEFDPIIMNDVPSAEVADRIFEGLYTYKESTGISPLIAKGEPEVSKGGARYVVEMKDGVTFSNGDPVTPEDVIYTFNAPVKEETENASDVNMIDTMKAVDDRTVQFDLKYPFGPFPDTLASWYVVPKSVREQNKKKFNKEEPVGSGPFVFEDWKEGNFVRLTRNADYWGDPKPKLREIEMVPVTESTTRVTTLKSGDNDIIKTIPPKQYPTVKAMQDVKIQEVPGMGYFYLAFNCKQGPTTNKKVREAVDYTFSMDQAVSNYVEPTGVRQYSPLPDAVASDWGMPVEKWKQIPHDKDVDKAKQLFDEAGVDKGYSWKILVPPDQKRKQIGISVSNGLKAAGFGNVQVQQLDWGQFLEKYNTGSEKDYNMYTLGWSGTPDPDAFTYYLFGRTEDVLGVNNGTYYGANSQSGKEAAQKFVEARKSTKRKERKQLYVEGITTALEDRAHIPAYNLKNAFGVKKYVKDFLAHPVDSFHISTDHNNTYIQK